MVQTGQAEKPLWGDEHVRPTQQEVAGHHHLVAVEDAPGDVTAAEHNHDADDDQCAVDLTFNIQPASAVGKSRYNVGSIN